MLRQTPPLWVLGAIVLVMVALNLGFVAHYTHPGPTGPANALYTTPDETTRDRLQALADAMGVTVSRYVVAPDCTRETMPAWSTTPSASLTPAVIGYCQELKAQLSPAAFEAVMAHEMAHLQTRTQRARHAIYPLIIAFLLAVVLIVRAKIPLTSADTARRARLLIIVHLVAFMGSMALYQGFRYQEEHRADVVAAQQTSPAAMRQALLQLTQIPIAPPPSCGDRPSVPAKIFCIISLNDLFPSHPSQGKRLAKIHALSGHRSGVR